MHHSETFDTVDLFTQHNKNIKHGFAYGRLNIGFGKRNDTDEAVVRNRSATAEAAGFSPENIISLKQTHSNIVHVVDESNKADYISHSKSYATMYEGDALITNIENVMLCVQTADCAPILIAAKNKKYVAAIHCGWRGVISGIIDSTMDKLKSLGCDDLLMAIGPCIHRESLECSGIDGLPESHIFNVGDRKFFDLPLYCKDRIESFVSAECYISPYDTYAMPDRYFSYRREQESYGVQFSFVGLVC